VSVEAAEYNRILLPCDRPGMRGTQPGLFLKWPRPCINSPGDVASLVRVINCQNRAQTIQLH
jgi:hypothetical protein